MHSNHQMVRNSLSANSSSCHYPFHRDTPPAGQCLRNTLTESRNVLRKSRIVQFAHTLYHLHDAIFWQDFLALHCFFIYNSSTAMSSTSSRRSTSTSTAPWPVTRHKALRVNAMIPKTLSCVTDASSRAHHGASNQDQSPRRGEG
jgi:hypothetical protein